MTNAEKIRKAVEAMDDKALLNIARPKPAYLRKFEQDGVQRRQGIQPARQHIFNKKADGAL